jgi:hypothetical protein
MNTFALLRDLLWTACLSTANPDTPAGSYAKSVSASGNAGGPQHATGITFRVE